jgi:PAS domain S-box-containing protein
VDDSGPKSNPLTQGQLGQDTYSGGLGGEAALLIASVPASIAVFDTQMRYVAISNHAISTFGMPPADEVIGRLPEEIFPDMPAYIREAHERVLEGEEFAWEQDSFTGRQGDALWVRGAMKPWRLADGRVAGSIVFADIINEHVEARSALNESQDRLRIIVDTAQEGIWAVDLDGNTTFVNPRLGELLGCDHAAMIGKPMALYCFPQDEAEARERLASNLEGNKEEFEFRYRRADGKPVHVLAATAPLKNRDGIVTGALGGFLDLSERRRAEERQHALMLELAHRNKNLLAVIQSIANRTLSSAASLDDAKTAFSGRLHALSRAYGSLTDEAFEGALIHDIVSGELAPFGGRAHTAGPQIMLNAKAAQTFALVLHELSTNATKYGALSVNEGHVEVFWATEACNEGRQFEFAWAEIGGPAVEPPLKRGFGTALISTVAGAEFNCLPVLIYDEGGFRYRFETPLANLGMAIEESPVRKKLKSEILCALYDAWASLRGPGGQLPNFARFDQARFEASGGLIIAQIGRDGSLEFLALRPALVERLGGNLDPSDFASGESDRMAEAYRRCARSAEPCYEHARFDFGDGEPVTFERLLVPFSSGGARVTHLAGIAVFSGQTGPQKLSEER